MTEAMVQDDTVTLNKTTPPFQLLPMSKVDQSHYAFIRRRLYSKRKVKEYSRILFIRSLGD